jgi:hypothetical protein
MSFKIVHEDEHHLRLAHPDGHEVKIAKAGLSEALLNKISSLPKMAEGGEVPEQPFGDKAMGFLKNLGTGVMTGFKDPEPQPTQPAGLSNMPLVNSQAPIQQTAVTPIDKVDTRENSMQKAMGNYAAAENAQANALAQQGKMQSDAYKKEAAATQDFSSHLQQARQEIEHNISGLHEFLQSNEVKPHKFLDEMSTGKHIRTAIGLILGGMGAGLTGGENQALKFLNAQIDRDIESQKANLGKSENMLGAYLKEYGNITDAQNALKLSYQVATQNAMGQIAGQMAGPQAKANAQLNIAKMQAQMAPAMDQLALRRAAMKYGQGQMGGAGSQSVSAMLIPTIEDKTERENAYKQLSEASRLSSLAKNAISTFDNLAGMTGAGIASPRERGSALEAVTGELIKEEGGKINEALKGQVAKLFPQAGESAETRNNKRQRLIELIKTKYNFPVLDANMIPYPKLDLMSVQPLEGMAQR